MTKRITALSHPNPKRAGKKPHPGSPGMYQLNNAPIKLKTPSINTTIAPMIARILVKLLVFAIKITFSHLRYLSNNDTLLIIEYLKDSPRSYFLSLILPTMSQNLT